MGWSFSWDKSFKKADLIERFLRPGFFKVGVSIIDHRVVGNHFWAVLQEGEDKEIWLALMESGGHESGWGYKSLSETCGPYEVDCPLSLLEQCTAAPNDSSAAWRKSVAEWHKAQKRLNAAKSSVAPGMKLEVSGTVYTTVRALGPRKGWVVEDEHGKHFRMPCQQIARCLSRILNDQDEAAKTAPMPSHAEQLSFI